MSLRLGVALPTLVSASVLAGEGLPQNFYYRGRDIRFSTRSGKALGPKLKECLEEESTVVKLALDRLEQARKKPDGTIDFEIILNDTDDWSFHGAEWDPNLDPYTLKLHVQPHWKWSAMGFSGSFKPLASSKRCENIGSSEVISSLFQFERHKLAAEEAKAARKWAKEHEWQRDPFYHDAHGQPVSEYDYKLRKMDRENMAY